MFDRSGLFDFLLLNKKNTDTPSNTEPASAATTSAKCPEKWNRLWLIAEFVIERAGPNGVGIPL